MLNKPYIERKNVSVVFVWEGNSRKCARMQWRYLSMNKRPPNTNESPSLLVTFINCTVMRSRNVVANAEHLAFKVSMSHSLMNHTARIKIGKQRCFRIVFSRTTSQGHFLLQFSTKKFFLSMTITDCFAKVGLYSVLVVICPEQNCTLFRHPEHD